MLQVNLLNVGNTDWLANKITAVHCSVAFLALGPKLHEPFTLLTKV